MHGHKIQVLYKPSPQKYLRKYNINTNTLVFDPNPVGGGVPLRGNGVDGR